MTRFWPRIGLWVVPLALLTLLIWGASPAQCGDEGTVNVLPLSSEAQQARSRQVQNDNRARVRRDSFGYGPYGYGSNDSTSRLYFGYGNGPYGNGAYRENRYDNRGRNVPAVGGYGYGYPNVFFRPRAYRWNYGGYGISDDFGSPNYNPLGYGTP
ncbi:MAG: hypothetical protein NT069_23685 [Planctomycetota bacterium]|nr:hypothetical protein [Planctomycetota bacterium]